MLLCEMRGGPEEPSTSVHPLEPVIYPLTEVQCQSKVITLQVVVFMVRAVQSGKVYCNVCVGVVCADCSSMVRGRFL